MLTRDAFLAAATLAKEAVEIPALGGSAYVRTMTAGERDRFEAEHLKDPSRDFRARVAVATLCDEEGRLLFAAADVPALSAIPYAALDPVVEVAMRLSRIGAADVKALEGN